MKYEKILLENGLRIAICTNPQAKVNHVAFFVRGGSRDETIRNSGLAHLIEHTLFKGTKNRSTTQILNSIDSVGGELNAYTTKELTCLYASCPQNYLALAIDVIGDIVSNSLFPVKEIEKEKIVIKDEINLYKDSPSELIYDDFEELIFKGHPLSNSILGDPDKLESLTQKEIFAFYRTNYCVKNLTVAVYTSKSVADIVSLITKSTQALNQGKKQSLVPIKLKSKSFNTIVKKDFSQFHHVIGKQAYANKHKNKSALILLNNILGGPSMNSVLNMNIREKYGYTYQIESNYQSYFDGGLFSVYFATDKAQYEKTKKLVMNELSVFPEKQLTKRKIEKAKEQFIGQLIMAQESPINAMLSVGKNLLLHDSYESFEEIIQRMSDLKAEQLLSVANEMLDIKTMSSLTYEPTK